MSKKISRETLRSQTDYNIYYYFVTTLFGEYFNGLILSNWNCLMIDQNVTALPSSHVYYIIIIICLLHCFWQFVIKLDTKIVNKLLC